MEAQRALLAAVQAALGRASLHPAAEMLAQHAAQHPA